MNFFRALIRPISTHEFRRRSTLLDLHRRGVVQVFRRHSFYRLWEPLRENPVRHDDFLG